MTEYLHPWTAPEEKRGWHGESAEYRAKAFLQSTIPKHGVAAELGVHKGRLTRVILEVTQPAKLHLVDMWYLLGEEWEWGGGDRSTLAGFLGVVRDNAEDLYTGRISIHVGNDLEIIPTFPDNYFDWVYIDTLHSYEHVSAELRLLTTKVRPGGIVAGDDYGQDWGIPQAIDDYLTEVGGAEMIYASDEDSQWAIRFYD